MSLVRHLGQRIGRPLAVLTREPHEHSGHVLADMPRHFSCWVAPRGYRLCRAVLRCWSGSAPAGLVQVLFQIRTKQFADLRLVEVRFGN
jgi:hypothetical protein